MENNKRYLFLSLTLCGVCVAILALSAAYFLLKDSKQNPAIINVEGSGFITTTPDIATIDLTIRAQAKQTKDAQVIVKNKAEKILQNFAALKISDKDIKTENYATYPKYEYATLPACQHVPCPVSKPILAGYEVTQNISLKLRDLDNLSKVFEVLGNEQISEFSGPNFMVDNLENVKAQARERAINNAKEKAQKLADQLGVKLVRITSFNEFNAMPPRAMMMKMAAVNAENSADAAPQFNQGESKIVSNVNISYEIR